MTADIVREVVGQQRARLAAQLPVKELDAACRLYEDMMTSAEFPDFLTLGAYELLD